MSTDPRDLQNMIHKLAIYNQQWGLTLNTQKSKIMIFAKRSVKPGQYKFKYNDTNVNIVYEYKYLGINFVCE